MQLLRVRQPPVREPEAFVEAFRIHDDRLALPAADGAAEVQRIVRVSLDLPFLLPRIGVNQTPVPVAAAHHDKYPLAIAVFQELHAVPVLEHAGAARWQAADEHQVVLEEGALTVDLQVPSPPPQPPPA